MKDAIFLVLLTFTFCPPLAASPGTAGPLGRVTLYGSEYVRLDDWARANHLQLRWTSPKHELKLSNGSTTFEFTVDSVKISVNGINVWIAAPVALRDGFAFVSPMDVTATLQPFLSPPRMTGGRTLRTIVLDPGHGGKDPGHQTGRQLEKKHTLLFARELKDQLTRAGFKVSLTRRDDSFVDLPQRPEIARRNGADLFLCLHFNAADVASVRGVEVYAMTPAHASSTNARGEGADSGAYPGNRFDSKNIMLAYELQRALVTRLGLEDRGVRRARFAVLRSAEMPAVLIEGGFLTNPAEARKLFDPVYRQQMARTIVDGVLSYKRLVE